MLPQTGTDVFRSQLRPTDGTTRDIAPRCARDVGNVTRYTRRSATYIGSLTLGAKVLERFAAFVQIAVIAAVFGATTQSDLYFIASIVPLTIGTIVGEALATSTLPWLVRRQSSDDLVHHLSATFWMSAATLVVAFALYVGVMAVAVTRYAPPGSTSLLPWLAFSQERSSRLDCRSISSSVLLLRERYTWPPFRAAAAAIFGLALMGISLIFTDSVTLIAASTSAGYAIACGLLFGDVNRAFGWSWLKLPRLSELREVVTLRGNVSVAIIGGVVGGQSFVLVERALASSLGVGVVSTISCARNRLYLEHRGAGGRHRTLPGDAAGARSAGCKRLYAAH